MAASVGPFLKHRRLHDMEKVTLSAAMVRRLIRGSIDAGLTGLDVDPEQPIEVYCNQPMTVGLTLLKPGQLDNTAGVKTAADAIAVTEPSIGCGDTIIVSPANEFGASIVSQFGNVWKITGGRSNKGDTVPHTWLLNSVPAKIAGKFAGGNKKNITQESMPADQSDPARWCKVVFACKFPETFNWKEYNNSLKMKGITISHLNSVVYDVADSTGRIAKKDGEQIAESRDTRNVRIEQDASEGSQDQSEA